MSHARWPSTGHLAALPGDPADTQSRYIEAAVNGVLIATLYAPKGNPQPGPKFKYKLACMKRLLVHAARALRPRCAGRIGDATSAAPLSRRILYLPCD
jgi:exodeoxyribonuclease-3